MPTHTVRAGVLIGATAWNNGRKLVRTSDGTLWCVYEFWNAGMYEVRASYSTDEGLTWTEEIVVVPAGGHDEDYCYHPALAVDSQDRLHLVYQDHWRINLPLQIVDSIRYCIRDAVGWSAPVIITTLNSTDPSIAIDLSDNIHVAYNSLHTVHLRNNVRYIRTTAGVWGAEEWITEIFSAFGQYYVAIAIDALSDVHLVWQGTGWGANPGNYNIQYRKRQSGVWQAQEALTDLAANQLHPTIAIDSSDDVHVAWCLTVGGIEYRERTTGGWQLQETVVAGDGSDPTIALDLADDIFITYYTTTGIDQIWTVEKPLGGVWQAPVNITNSAWDNDFPILIWANHPTISGVKTNIPLTGHALVFTADTVSPEVRYYYLNLLWRPLVPTVITKATVQTLAATGIT